MKKSLYDGRINFGYDGRNVELRLCSGFYKHSNKLEDFCLYNRVGFLQGQERSWSALFYFIYIYKFTFVSSITIISS